MTAYLKAGLTESANKVTSEDVILRNDFCCIGACIRVLIKSNGWNKQHDMAPLIEPAINDSMLRLLKVH